MSSRIVIHTLPFASHLSTSNARELIERDRARAQKLARAIHPHGPKAFKEARRRRHHHGQGGGTSGDPPASGGSGEAGVDVTDAGVTYTASVGVGSPATQYTLLIDTGETCLSSLQECVPNVNVSRP